jgi:hypothetical protein
MNARQVIVIGNDAPTGSLPFENSRNSVDFRLHEHELSREFTLPSESVGETREFLTEMMGTQVTLEDLPVNAVPVPSPSRSIRTYPNGKVAVKDFSLAMLEGQITCLLGTEFTG